MGIKVFPAGHSYVNELMAPHRATGAQGSNTNIATTPSYTDISTGNLVTYTSNALVVLHAFVTFERLAAGFTQIGVHLADQADAAISVPVLIHENDLITYDSVHISDSHVVATPGTYSFKIRCQLAAGTAGARIVGGDNGIYAVAYG